ncbi:hypothetical protein MTR67_002600 [Solanum verrucosum]|uniref:Uncharacterized protein n=1 Tax=Solanum verrucosum TaxID=315347 RepID=A0AAF0PSQ8_SOLVR|nr:hypothetical protein MTR67_002600 [Solanum verrucosum]
MNHIYYMSRAIIIMWRLTMKKPTFLSLHALPYYNECYNAHEESKAVTKATAMKGNPFSCGYAAVACAGKK